MGADALIIGAGYVGVALARSLADSGATVVGVAREGSSLEAIAAAGARPLRLDLDREDPPRAALGPVTTLHYLAPPPGEGDDDPRLARLLGALADEPCARLVYVSTSGVYGDCGGAWVDETRPAAPKTPRAWRRWRAEERCRAFALEHGVELAILRVPGIYGPGRLPVERLRAGLPVLREDESPYTNRIHRDDLVQALRAAGAPGAGQGVVNAGDGHPTTMTDYFRRVADALGLPRPPEVSREEAGAALTPELLSFLGESRRLVIRRLIEEFGVRLLHPDLESGIPASISKPLDAASRPRVK